MLCTDAVKIAMIISRSCLLAAHRRPFYVGRREPLLAVVVQRLSARRSNRPRPRSAGLAIDPRRRIERRPREPEDVPVHDRVELTAGQRSGHRSA